VHIISTAVCHVSKVFHGPTSKQYWHWAHTVSLSTHLLCSSCLIRPVHTMDRYGGGNVVVTMQEPTSTTVHETIYGTSETRSETSLAGPTKACGTLSQRVLEAPMNVCPSKLAKIGLKSAIILASNPLCRIRMSRGHRCDMCKNVT
jgi:hypothetical protein